MTTAAMSVQDALWLTMDRPNNLMVVDGAMILRGTPTPEAMTDLMSRTAKRFPVLARRPVRHGTGWAWEDDPDFDVARHLNERTASEPMSLVDVQHTLAAMRSEPLPKDRALWQCTVMSPVTLDDGTLGSAVISRFHHSIADGVRLTQLILGMCETDDAGVAAVVARQPANRVGAGSEAADTDSDASLQGKDASDTDEDDDSVVDVAWQTATDAVGKTVRGLSDVAWSVAHAARHPRTTATKAVTQGAQAVTDAPGMAASAVSAGIAGVNDSVGLLRHPDRMLDALDVLGVPSSRGTNDVGSVAKLALASSEATVWTGEPGTHKALAWSDQLPLADIKAVGKDRGMTINDVLLAAIAGALRRYLADRNESLDEVIWMVPVNLKPFEDNLPPDLGNYFALVFLPMPLDSDDPDERLAQMHHRMDRIKHSDEAVLTFGLQRVVSTSPSQIAFFLTNFFANKAVGVLTNVPGPRAPMTFAGEPVEQVVGFAPCSGNQPMTATIFSYNGGVTVGFATDADLIAEPDLLVRYVVDDLTSMGVPT